MPLPAAHGLLGVLAVMIIRPRISFRQDWRFLLLAAFLAITPDFDFFFVWILNWGEDWHRGFTHSVFMAAITTVIIYSVNKFSDLRSAVAIGVGVLSHPILDYLTTKLDIGVELLFPFSDKRFRLGLIGYFEFTQKEYSAMDLITIGLLELIVLLPIFLVVLRAGGYLSNTIFTKRRF
jgi:membrane-bound metal-dependent hydrolase YbcI (DUF457 family)